LDEWRDVRPRKFIADRVKIRDPPRGSSVIFLKWVAPIDIANRVIIRDSPRGSSKIILKWVGRLMLKWVRQNSSPIRAQIE
jgi:hypothetical protein